MSLQISILYSEKFTFPPETLDYEDEDNEYEEWPARSIETVKALVSLPKGEQVMNLEARILPEDHKLKGQRGVFASEDIKQWDVVAFYEGNKTRSEKVSHPNSEYNLFVIEDTTNKLYVIDPTANNSGNLSMFINDYRDDVNNLGSGENKVEKINVFFLGINVDYECHVVVVANRDIHKGEEILVDYGYQYWHFFNQKK